MNSIRPAAVAGSFYPGQPRQLAEDVSALLRTASIHATAMECPKALIVPHAGYIYSGPIAASAYALLSPWGASVRRVVLLGPVHRVPVRGLALPQCDAFETPLGVVPLDTAGMAALARLPQVTQSAAAHALEHSLEVQLPFLQQTLDDFVLLPLAVGDATTRKCRTCWIPPGAGRKRSSSSAQTCRTTCPTTWRASSMPPPPTPS
jgi:AmmeMemoRadiSam system protein B